MKTRIRRITKFAAAVLIAQALAFLFLTPAGIDLLFPPAARVNAEKFSPESNTYAVYYDLRVEVSQADLIVVGIDYGIAESFDLLGHFTRFAKQYNNYSAVLLDMTIAQQNVAQNVFLQDEEGQFLKRITVLQERTGMSADFCDYLTELFLINRTMTAIRKLNVYSYAAPTEDDYVMNAEELRAMSDPERIMAAFRSTERSAICAVHTADLMYSSEFRTGLDALAEAEGIKVLYLQTQYAGSSAEGEGHPEYRFPDYHTSPTVFLVENAGAEWYYRYYTAVAGKNYGKLTDPLDTRFTDHYFVVTHGTPVKTAETSEPQPEQENQP